MMSKMSITSAKTNRVLQVILLAFLAIVLRIWHLEVIQREDKLQEAVRPQQRNILLRADRGTICDRFNIPLALNRICYNAAIYYGQIAQIPVVSWKTNEEGKRVRVYERKEYIRELAKVLADLIDVDAGRIEDLIHSKASLFPHVPFIVKAGISEEEHYRLKMLEKDWLGIHAEIAAERFYPLGKTACNLIGSMGAISSHEYAAIAGEINILQQAIETYEQGIENSLPDGYGSFEEVYRRFHELKEKAYTLNDLVGKTGIEAQFEEELRGYFGKKIFEVDQKGRSLRELSGGRPSVAGRQVVLSISSELQQFAESLLAQDDKARDGRSLGLDPADKKRKVQKQPWIKGGAIVALDPNTGEVLALASYPRFDPNDFIPSGNPALKNSKQNQICRWLESDHFISSVWDGKESLVRERYLKQFTEDRQELSWEFYLDLILPAESPIRSFFHRVDTVKGAIQVQEDLEALLYFSKAPDPLSLMDALFPEGQKNRSAIIEALRSSPEAHAAEKRLESLLNPIASNSDKLFAIDLCRMAVYSPAFTDPLIAQIGSLKISAYRSLCQSFQRIEIDARRLRQEKFHKEEFAAWREAHQKEFLAEKRKWEKEKKTFARPYVDYLDQKEKELFAVFWEENKLELLRELISEQKEEVQLRDFCKKLDGELSEQFIRTFRSFSQLDRPLLTTYKTLRNRKGVQTEKDLAAAFYPIGGFGFTRSFAFQSGTPQGSIFKLVTSYAGLVQGQNPTLVDEINGQTVAFQTNGTPYPRFYKGGRLPRSHLPRIGKIDISGALEQSSNSYFAVLAGDYLENPEDLSRAAKVFGYGEKTGIELPGETRGKVPSDIKSNRTGLYSTAIGQHTLLNTPLQTASMLAAIANGGYLLKPKIAKAALGFSPDRQPLDVFSGNSYFAKEQLNAIGIPFPLFTSVQSHKSHENLLENPTEIKRQVPLSSQVRTLLLEGMDKAVWSAKGSARPSVIRHLLSNPMLMREYLSLEHQMIGKTSTAEILYNPNLNPSNLPQMYKHIWFGAISFVQDPLHPVKMRWEYPELVVVVFLRYGDGGKEAAPLAAQMIRKWREIKSKHQQ